MPTLRPEHMWKKVCFILVLGIIIYGFLIEPSLLRVRYVTVTNPPLAKVLGEKKIALLSDLHLGAKATNLQTEVTEALGKINPDLILFTGDFVTWFGNRQAYLNALKFLSGLDAPLGIYAVMGDSDYSTSRYSCWFCHETGTDLPGKSRLIFLRNSLREISTGSSPVRLIGIDSHSDEGLAEQHFLKRITDYGAAIVISHTSLPFQQLKGNKIFMAAGDTHGGQLRLPAFLWKIFKRKPDPEHMYGFYQEGGSSLYVTSGIGTSTLPLRIGVPPEIAVFRFVP